MVTAGAAGSMGYDTARGGVAVVWAERGGMAGEEGGAARVGGAVPAGGAAGPDEVAAGVSDEVESLGWVAEVEGDEVLPGARRGTGDDGRLDPWAGEEGVEAAEVE